MGLAPELKKTVSPTFLPQSSPKDPTSSKRSSSSRHGPLLPLANRTLPTLPSPTPSSPGTPSDGTWPSSPTKKPSKSEVPSPPVPNSTMHGQSGFSLSLPVVVVWFSSSSLPQLSCHALEAEAEAAMVVDPRTGVTKANPSLH